MPTDLSAAEICRHTRDDRRRLVISRKTPELRHGGRSSTPSVPILTERVHYISIKHTRLTRIFQSVLLNRRIVPRRSMRLAPYFIPIIATAVKISLGKEKVREYETAAQIYRGLLVAYLRQDVAALNLAERLVDYLERSSLYWTSDLLIFT